MSDLQIFNFNNQPLNVVLQNGEPFFIAKEVCDVLEHTNSRKAIQDLCDIEDVTTGYIPHPQSPSKQLQVNLVNEGGLYALIFGSRLEKAKVFKKWVTSEVLPSIRKHGAYMTTSTAEEIASNPDLLIKLAETIKSERAEKAQALEQLQLANNTIQLQAPKVKALEQILGSDSLLTTTQVAQNLQLSAVTLNKKLAEKKIQHKVGGSWVLNARYLSEGYAKLIPVPYIATSGEQKTNNQLKWTEKGREFIRQTFTQQSV